MSNSVVIGAGWHPSLFRQEATQLIESYEFVHAHALICDAPDARRLISRSSLISEVLSPGGIVSVGNVIETVAESFLELNINGSVAVKSSRTGEKIEGWSGQEIAGEIGGKLVEAERKIDLTNPDITLRIHLLPHRINRFTHTNFRLNPLLLGG